MKKNKYSAPLTRIICDEGGSYLLAGSPKFQYNADAVIQSHDVVQGGAITVPLQDGGRTNGVGVTPNAKDNGVGWDDDWDF